MKAIKILGNNEILTSALLVMCALGYVGWGWFWAALILSEINACIWYADSRKQKGMT